MSGSPGDVIPLACPYHFRSHGPRPEPKRGLCAHARSMTVAALFLQSTTFVVGGWAAFLCGWLGCVRAW